MDGFAHLHVASGFSMRYGASMPEDLVARAADLGQGALALTDRDGLYGAVRFATACGQAGVDPVLGVDLAVEEPAGTAAPARVRTPVRGGAVVDPRRPRVTVLARGRAGGAGPGVGWAALCRLVTATHLRGERGVPVTTPGLLAQNIPDVAFDPLSADDDVCDACHRQGITERITAAQAKLDDANKK